MTTKLELLVWLIKMYQYSLLTLSQVLAHEIMHTMGIRHDQHEYWTNSAFGQKDFQTVKDCIHSDNIMNEQKPKGASIRYSACNKVDCRLSLRNKGLPKGSSAKQYFGHTGAADECFESKLTLLIVIRHLHISKSSNTVTIIEDKC